MTRCRLAMFDFDGTLADSVGWLIGALAAVSGRYGLEPFDPDTLDELRGLDTGAIMARLGLPLWKVPALAREMRRRMHEDIDSIALFAGVPALLNDLHAAGVGIAIVTSNSEENVRRVLGNELAARIDAFECGVSIFGKKPKLAAAMKRCGSTPTESIYIGDELRDADAAAALGIDFLGVGWGVATPEALQRRTGSMPCADLHALRAALLGR